MTPAIKKHGKSIQADFYDTATGKYYKAAAFFMLVRQFDQWIDSGMSVDQAQAFVQRDSVEEL